MSWRGRAQEAALNQQQHHCIQGCLAARSGRTVDCHCTSSSSSCTRGTPRLPALVCVSAEHCPALPLVVTLPVKTAAPRRMTERPWRCPFSAAVGRLREPARRAGTDEITADGKQPTMRTTHASYGRGRVPPRHQALSAFCVAEFVQSLLSISPFESLRA